MRVHFMWNLMRVPFNLTTELLLENSGSVQQLSKTFQEHIN